MKNGSSRSIKTLNEKLKEIADHFEKLGCEPVENPVAGGESISLSIAKISAQINESQVKALKSLLASSGSINKGLLERVCNSDPEMAAARHRPPIRSRSMSLDAICCALELLRCRRLVDRDAAAKWIVKKSDGLVDKKIAGVALSLANPGYQRNRGKHRKDSSKRKELKLETLDSHRAWAKYRKLATEGFSSTAFAAVLLAAEYELGNDKARSKKMPDGLLVFLGSLGFYDEEVAGYSSLIRDEGAVAARIGWGYSYKDQLKPKQ